MALDDLDEVVYLKIMMCTLSADHLSMSYVLLMQRFSEVFPHLLTAVDVPKLVKIDDLDFSNIDAAFCCLPHATTQVREKFLCMTNPNSDGQLQIG